MPIFKLDSEGLPILDTIAIGMTPEYKVLMRTKKRMAGDHDGRKKIRNLRELTFVWHYCDYASDGIQRGLVGDDLFEFARDQADLPVGWTMDDDVIAAVERYTRDTDTVIIKLNKDLLRSFANSEKTLDLLNRISAAKLIELEQVVDNPTDEDDVPALISFIITTQREILSISKELPDRIQSLSKYDELLKREKEDIKQGLGNSIIPTSAMRDYN